MASSLVQRDPFRSLFSFPRWIDEFEEPIRQRGLKIHETEKDIIVEAVVAGVPAKEVEINIEDGVLTVKAESKDDETKYYQYYYTVALSGGQWDQAEANIENGVVIVSIPKAEAARPRKIEVKERTDK